ncbi:MAG TPA: hypothetical protein ENK26_11880, partial [Gammaproteobacteria bacterium]|nr:hypothetical protein [Gammaproteobacteria bacterium]
ACTDSEKDLAFVTPTETLCKAWPLLAEPYKGLNAFSQEDANLFFGREELVKLLADKCRADPFVAVVGASGSGKSSLVMAGLIPELGTTGDWATAVCRPGRRPLYNFAHAIQKMASGPDEGPNQILEGAGKLKDALREDPGRIVDHVSLLLKEMPRYNRALLVVDQFEELFTLATTGEEGDSRSREFVDVLAAIAEAGDASPLKAVITLRADFMGQALQNQPLAGLLQGAADVKVGPMSPTELQKAIKEPAARFGVSFEPGLVAEIVSACTNAAGNLPMMEFALDRLWCRQENRVMGSKAYGELGGVVGALAEHAEEVFGRLKEKHKPLVRRVLTRLVRLAAPGTQAEDTRAVILRSEIREAEWEVVNILAQARLVVTATNLVVTATDEETIVTATNEETIEVAHEALIRAWPRLRGWLDEDREFGLWRQRLQGDIERWNDKNQDALLRGDLLAEAAAWRKSKGDDLNVAEQEFIKASLAQKDREEAEERKRTEDQKKNQARWIKRLSGAVLALVLALGIAGYYWAGAKKAESAARASARIAVGHRAAADALTMLTEASGAASAARAASLAIEALKLVPSSANARTAALQSYLELPVLKINLNAPVLAVEYNPVNSTIIALTLDTLYVLEPDSGEERLRVTLETEEEFNNFHDIVLVVSPRGDRVFVQTQYTVSSYLFSVETGEEIAQFPLFEAVGGAPVAFDPKGERLFLSTGGESVIHVLNADDGETMVSFETPEPPSGITFNDTGSRIAVTSRFSDFLYREKDFMPLHVFDATNLSAPPKAFPNSGVFLATAFWPDDRHVAAMTESGGLFLYSIEIPDSKGEPLTTESVLGSTPKLAVWGVGSERGNEAHIAAAHSNAIRSFVDQYLMMPENERIVLDSEVTDIQFHPTGSLLASASIDGTARVSGVYSGQEILRAEHDGPVMSVSLQPDGRRFATASGDGFVRVFSLQFGDEAGLEDVAPSQPRFSLEYDLATKEFIVVDQSSGEEYRRFSIVGREFGTVGAVSPDGQSVAINNRQFNGSEIFHGSSGRPVVRIEHNRRFEKIVFDHSSTLVALQDFDGTILVANVGDGTEVLRTGPGLGTLQAFTPQNDGLIIKTLDDSLRVIPVTAEKIIDRLCSNRIGSNLSQDDWDRYLGPQIVWQATCENWVTLPTNAVARESSVSDSNEP